MNQPLRYVEIERDGRWLEYAKLDPHETTEAVRDAMRFNKDLNGGVRVRTETYPPTFEVIREA